MGSKHIRTDVNLAWPTAEIAVMGPEGAVNIIYRRELAAAAEGNGLRQKKIEEFKGALRPTRSSRPERGFVDDVIEPHETRPRVIAALRMLENKVDTMPRKKAREHSALGIWPRALRHATVRKAATTG